MKKTLTVKICHQRIAYSTVLVNDFGPPKCFCQENLIMILGISAEIDSHYMTLEINKGLKTEILML